MPRKPASKNQLHQQLWPFALVVLFIFFVLAWYFTQKRDWRVYLDSRNAVQVTPATKMEGTIIFTALQPGAGAQGEVRIYARQQGEEQWQDTGVTVPLVQDAVWRWSQSLPGIVYELQAVVLVDGQEVDRSEVITTTAPAASVELPIEINWKDLPEEAGTGQATNLGGEVVINGYIPQGAILQVFALHPDDYEDNYEPITPTLLSRATLLARVSDPTPTVRWLWEKAVPREEYMVVPVLWYRGQLIGVADQLLWADAGEERLEHVINSQAQPPARGPQSLDMSSFLASAVAQAVAQPYNQGANISGVTYVVGPKQKNTSLLMLWRKPGQDNYQVINRYPYPTHTGTSWQWTGAQVGQQYEIMAALQVNDNNSSTAPNPTLVTAPAANVDFTLNTYYVIPRTSGRPVNQVCIDSNGKQSTAVLILPAIENATQYWLQVGADHGQSGIYNQKMPAQGNQDVKVQVRVDNGHTNYMRYAYATCDHCASDNDFAPYSDEVGFTCD